MEPKMDDIVAKYVELRDRRSQIKAAYEKEDATLKAMMAKIEAWLLLQMDKMGVKNAQTNSGTVYRTYNEFVNVADWPSLLSYIRAKDAWGLLERRVSKTTVKEIMAPDANGKYTAPPPPGVNFVREVAVQIRRS